MDAKRNTDLREAGKKRLEEFRQRKRQQNKGKSKNTDADTSSTAEDHAAAAAAECELQEPEQQASAPERLPDEGGDEMISVGGEKWLMLSEHQDSKKNELLNRCQEELRRAQDSESSARLELEVCRQQQDLHNATCRDEMVKRARLEDETRNLASAAAELRKSLEIAADEKSALSRQLEVMSHELALVRSQRDEDSSKLSLLEAQLHKLGAEYQQYREQKELQISTLQADLKAGKTQLEAETESLRASAAELRTNLEATAEEKSALLKQVTGMSSELRGQQMETLSKLNIYEVKVQRIEAESQQYKEDATRSESQIQELKVFLQKSQEDLQALQTETSGLRFQMTQQASEASSYKEKAARHESQCGDLKGAVEGMQRDLQEVQAEKCQLQSDLTLLLADKETGETEAQDARRQLKVRDQELGRLKEENVGLADQLAQLSGKLQDSDASRDSFSRDIEAMRLDIEAREEERARQKAQLDQFSGKLQDSDASREGFVRDIEVMRLDIAAREEERARQEAQISEMQEKLGSSLHEQGVLAENAEGLRQQLESLRDELKSSCTRLTNQIQEAESVRAENLNLEQRVAELNAKILELQELEPSVSSTSKTVEETLEAERKSHSEEIRDLQQKLTISEAEKLSLITNHETLEQQLKNDLNILEQELARFQRKLDDVNLEEQDKRNGWLTAVTSLESHSASEEETSKRAVSFAAKADSILEDSRDMILKTEIGLGDLENDIIKQDRRLQVMIKETVDRLVPGEQFTAGGSLEICIAAGVSVLARKIQDLGKQLHTQVSNLEEKLAVEERVATAQKKELERQQEEKTILVQRQMDDCKKLEATSRFIGEELEEGGGTTEADVFARLDIGVRTLFSKLKRENEALVEEARELSAQIIRLQESESLLQGALESGNVELHNANGKLEQANAKMTRCENEVKELCEQLESSRATLASLIQDQAALQGKLDVAIKEQNRLQHELFETEQKLASVREKLGLAIKKGKGLAQHRDELKQSLADKSAEVHSCKEKMLILETALEKAYADAKSETEARLNAEEMVSKAREELKSCRASITATEESEKALAGRVSELLRKLAETSEEKQLVERTSREAWLQIQELDTQLQTKTESEIQLQKALLSAEGWREAHEREHCITASKLNSVHDLLAENFNKKMDAFSDISGLAMKLSQAIAGENNSTQPSFQLTDDRSTCHESLELLRERHGRELSAVLGQASFISQLLAKCLGELAPLKDNTMRAFTSRLEAKEQERVHLTEQLSAKDEELEFTIARADALNEEVARLSGRVAELEQLVQDNQMAESMESSRSKTLSVALKKLQKQSEDILSTLEKLHAENLALQEKADRAERDKHSLVDRQRSELLLLLQGVAGSLPEAPEASEPSALIRVLDSRIQRLQRENENIMTAVQGKDLKLQDLEQKLGEMATEKLQLQNLIDTASSARASIAPVIEIEELEQPTTAHTTARHLRSQKRAPTSDHVVLNMDAYEAEEKGHGLKPLGSIRTFPRACHYLGDQIDALCSTAGRVLARQPVTRLSLIVYLIGIHLWWVITLLTTARR